MSQRASLFSFAWGTLLIVAGIACSGADDAGVIGPPPGGGSPGDEGGAPSVDGAAPSVDGAAPPPDGGPGPDAGPGDLKLPIGIPDPPFGLHEIAPPTPSPWNASTPGFYYVDATAPGATDDANDYGTPQKPRLSIPANLPAGAVVEVHGVYAQNHTSPYGFKLAGTAAKPIWIRGVDKTHRPQITGNWEVSGSRFILENLDFTGGSTKYQVVLLAPASYVALRTSDVHGTPTTGAMSVASFSAATCDHVLVAGNTIHDNGDLASTFDQDFHGISVGPNVSYLWVLYNEMARNSGDGIQINGGQPGQASLHHVYVGGNVSHHNRQSGFWTKQAVDVIFSQNVCYSHRPNVNSGTPGDCMGYQYAPEMVWFIANHIHDAEYGIGAGNDNGLGSGQYSFFVGNVIHDIHTTGTFTPGSGWANAGIMLAGGIHRAIVHNTIYDVDTGISSPSTVGEIYMAGNIVSKVTQAQGSHVLFEMGALASASPLDRNLYGGPFRFDWGGQSYSTLGAFQAAQSGKCASCANGDPMLVAPDNEDFHLADSSPAIDAAGAAADPVYAIFKQRYGIDIQRDIGGTARPQGAGWDVGAYEHP